jgi:type IV secretory pathway TrbD component
MMYRESFFSRVWATLAVFAARHDPDFAAALMRHLRQRGYFSC